MIEQAIFTLIGTFWNASNTLPFFEKDIQLVPGQNHIQTEAPWNNIALVDPQKNTLPDLQYIGTDGSQVPWATPDNDPTETPETWLTKLLSFDDPRTTLTVYSDKAVTLTAQFYNTHTPEQNLTAQAGITDFDTGIDFNDFEFGETLLDGVELTKFQNKTVLGNFSKSHFRPQYITRSGWDADETLREWNISRGVNNYFRSVPLEAKKYLPKTEWPTIQTKESENGKKLTWPIEENKDIKKIIVHHTGEYVDDTQQMRRTPREHMRAIYQYHTLTKKWGDIGYNFVIDKNGNIYEGRAGGPKTVGAHTSFYNVGTIGISLMGNFNIEEPTDNQLKVLSILLSYLSEKYTIDPQSQSEFLGITSPNIAGHRDVARRGYGTACPGTNLIKRLPQIRTTVEEIKDQLSVQRDGLPSGLDFLGKSTTAPQYQRRLPRFKRAEKKPLITGELQEKRILQRGEQKTLNLEFTNNSKRTWPRYSTIMARILPDGMESSTFINEMPIPTGESGTFTGTLTVHGTPNGHHQVTLDPIFLKDSYFEEDDRPKFSIPIQVSGTKNLLTIPRPTNTIKTNTSPYPLGASFFRNAQPIQETKVKLAFFDKNIAEIYSKDTVFVQHKNKVITQVPPHTQIKILLKNPKTITITTQNKTWVLDEVSLITDSVLRIGNYKRDLSSTVLYNQFRRRLNIYPQAGNKLLIVNQLPLEQYLAGLAEEPSTEPLEKKHAIHVLARSYAYVYGGERRKFRTHLYDLEDDPRTSQFYLGYDWERLHPEQRAYLKDTSGLVLTYKNKPVIGPYFTQSAGESSDKWSHQYPWTKAQKLPYDEGLEQRGHGVGLSGNTARALAHKGYDFHQIIKYFFDNVQIKKVY